MQDTGMIMDIVDNTKDLQEKNETMQTAVNEKQLEMLQKLAKRYKEAHTVKVREYKKIGRNDECPCGSGKKYKNCCLKTGKYENIVLKK